MQSCFASETGLRALSVSLAKSQALCSSDVHGWTLFQIAPKIQGLKNWTHWNLNQLKTPTGWNIETFKTKTKKKKQLTWHWNNQKKRLKLPETSKSPKFRHPVKLLTRCIVRCFSGVNVEENLGKPHYKKEINLPNLICFRGFSRWFSRAGFFSEAGGAQHPKDNRNA